MGKKASPDFCKYLLHPKFNALVVCCSGLDRKQLIPLGPVHRVLAEWQFALQRTRQVRVPHCVTKTAK